MATTLTFDPPATAEQCRAACGFFGGVSGCVRILSKPVRSVVGVNPDSQFSRSVTVDPTKPETWTKES